MKLAVISDAHGSSEALRLAIKAAGEVDGFIHLGDIAVDAGVIRKITNKSVYAVRGNCDPVIAGPDEKVVEFDGVKLFLTHGHKYDVNHSISALGYRAEELECNAALFGHTHIPMINAFGPIVIINPGSAALPRGGSRKSIALLEIYNGKISPSILWI